LTPDHHERRVNRKLKNWTLEEDCWRRRIFEEDRR
jgi:hypothetical protein